MRFFGKRRQQERENMERERVNIENAITAITAHLRCLEVLASGLIAELPPAKRDHLLRQLREVIDGLKVLPAPAYVPSHKQQDFRDELSSAAQVFIENAKNLKLKPTSPNR